MFCTFEGGEGSGKSTQIKLIKDLLEKEGHSVLVTREPGGVDVAESIRKVILDNEMDSVTEALLYAAARREHLVKKVLPALEEGKIVICDRFVDSSIVYQGIVKGVGVDAVKKINSFSIGDIMPDLTIVFDIDPKDASSRISSDKDREVNRFDMEDISFHRKIRDAYKSICSEKHHLIDASQDIESVTKDIMCLIKQKI